MTSLQKSASLAGCCSINAWPSCSLCSQYPAFSQTCLRRENNERHTRRHGQRSFTHLTRLCRSHEQTVSQSQRYENQFPPRPVMSSIVMTHAQRRRASVAADKPSDHDLHWPKMDNPRRIPTPYEIFNQSRNEPYSKRRFYDLVKVYHPDRQPSSDSHTHELRLDRYRLVIAANAILSDPTKRYAYDKTGRGWARWRTDVSGDNDLTGKEYKYTTFHRWRKDVREKYQFAYEDDPMFCATWEDWEKWYHRQENPHLYENQTWPRSFFRSSSTPQTEVFASNKMFLILVALVAALGGTLQATRIDSQAQSYRDKAMRKSEEVGKRLNEARDITLANAEQSKDQRIKKWVSKRDDYSENEHDGRSSLPGDDSLCAPAIMKDRNEVPFWKRPPQEFERKGE